VEDDLRRDLEATTAARRELGPAHDDELIEAFLERLDRRLAESSGASERALKRTRDHQREMTLGGMAISIPILAIAAFFAGLAGVIVVCAMLAVIAVASARG